MVIYENGPTCASWFSQGKVLEGFPLKINVGIIEKFTNYKNDMRLVKSGFELNLTMVYLLE